MTPIKIIIISIIKAGKNDIDSIQEYDNKAVTIVSKKVKNVINMLSLKFFKI
jgi:hypothetical protein